MVFNGSPDPPDNLQDDLSSPLCINVDFPEHAMDSDDDVEVNQYDGYAPLPLGPGDDNELIPWNNSVVSSDSSDDEETEEPEAMNVAEEVVQQPDDMPQIETVDREVSREIWTRPRDYANIEMNSEKAQEVMSAMANFSLPDSSIPEWAHSISEEEWKQHISNKINKTREDR